MSLKWLKWLSAVIDYLLRWNKIVFYVLFRQILGVHLEYPRFYPPTDLFPGSTPKSAWRGASDRSVFLSAQTFWANAYNRAHVVTKTKALAGERPPKILRRRTSIQIPRVCSVVLQPALAFPAFDLDKRPCPRLNSGSHSRDLQRVSSVHFKAVLSSWDVD